MLSRAAADTAEEASVDAHPGIEAFMSLTTFVALAPNNWKNVSVYRLVKRVESLI